MRACIHFSVLAYHQHALRKNTLDTSLACCRGSRANTHTRSHSQEQFGVRIRRNFSQEHPEQIHLRSEKQVRKWCSPVEAIWSNEWRHSAAFSNPCFCLSQIQSNKKPQDIELDCGGGKRVSDGGFADFLRHIEATWRNMQRSSAVLRFRETVYPAAFWYWGAGKTSSPEIICNAYHQLT